MASKESGGIDSITFSTSEGSVTLTKDDADRFLNGGGAPAAAQSLVEEVVRKSGSEFTQSDEGPKSEPERMYSRLIPGVAAFFNGDEWFESEELKSLADDLIGRWPELGHLTDYEIRVLWKAEGGGSKGRVLFGKCTKPSGLSRYFALCDWVIWLAADNCRGARFDDGQVEALLYHELKHCVLVGKDSKPGVVGHEFEVFGDEIRRYGFWNDGRKALGHVVQGRLRLDGE